MAGMRDVAKLANVSVSTVSAVLGHSQKNVSEETRKRVLKAAEALDYQLPKNKKNNEGTVAVVLPQIESVFFSALLHGIVRGVGERGLPMTVSTTYYNFAEEQKNLERLRHEHLLGLIIDTIVPLEAAENYFEKIAAFSLKKKIPVTILERRVPDYPLNYVYVDNYEAGVRATQHLLDLGHRNIAHITGHVNSPPSYERKAGYRDALKAAGLPVRQELIFQGDYTPGVGYMRTKEILAKFPEVSAIFAANDQTAIGAIKAIRSEGLEIPRQIAVVGFDNLSISSLIDPALTTISVPTFQMGLSAVELLFEDKPRGLKLDADLVVRKSTVPTSGSEWEVFNW